MLFHKGTQYCIETDTVFGKLNLRYKRVWQQSNGNSMAAEQWKQYASRAMETTTYHLFEVFHEYC